MGVSGQHHAPAALYPPGKGPPVPSGQEAGWAPEPVWTQRPEEKSSAFVGDRTPVVQSVVRHYMLSMILTELPRLLFRAATRPIFEIEPLLSAVQGHPPSYVQVLTVGMPDYNDTRPPLQFLCRYRTTS
jgi:hypothetical protein